MDAVSAYTSGGATASVMIIAGLVYKFFGTALNHMIVIRCCGRRAEMGFGVRDMPTDSPPKMSIKVPGEEDRSG